MIQLINVSKLKYFLVKEMFQLKGNTCGLKSAKLDDKEKIQQVILDAGHHNVSLMKCIKLLILF
jgi:hypothetical protein